ncbi:hypothetical protein ml_373 [Mollivirus sibericum]|uniref:hypothetical protein n=1 Tax=Mollivirus sibericum TaxID=1678078 RepID=UPI0006B2E8D3|nr:hypothetical protein ml_373 [Mollivirus sibericum]ALD62175.1 hypothetical protein ml_373 [Mollivirus sibericum]
MSANSPYKPPVASVAAHMSATDTMIASVVPAETQADKDTGAIVLTVPEAAKGLGVDTGLTFDNIETQADGEEEYEDDEEGEEEEGDYEGEEEEEDYEEEEGGEEDDPNNTEDQATEEEHQVVVDKIVAPEAVPSAEKVQEAQPAADKVEEVRIVESQASPVSADKAEEEEVEEAMQTELVLMEKAGELEAPKEVETEAMQTEVVAPVPTEAMQTEEEEEEATTQAKPRYTRRKANQPFANPKAPRGLYTHKKANKSGAASASGLLPLNSPETLANYGKRMDGYHAEDLEPLHDQMISVYEPSFRHGKPVYLVDLETGEPLAIAKDKTCPGVHLPAWLRILVLAARAKGVQPRGIVGHYGDAIKGANDSRVRLFKALPDIVETKLIKLYRKTEDLEEGEETAFQPGRIYVGAAVAAAGCVQSQFAVQRNVDNVAAKPKAAKSKKEASDEEEEEEVQSTRLRSKAKPAAKGTKKVTIVTKPSRKSHESDEEDIDEGCAYSASGSRKRKAPAKKSTAKASDKTKKTKPSASAPMKKMSVTNSSKTKAAAKTKAKGKGKAK